MKIYTRTGDDGTTGLIGSRVRKDDPRVAAYGDVDELNAVLGLACAEARGTEEALVTSLRGIQRDLFAIGAQLADPQSRVAGTRDKTQIPPSRIAELEQAIDAGEAALPALTAFILPGGAKLGAVLHLARTVCRRAERSVVSLAGQSTVEPHIVTYLNRLSDLLFVLARRENQRAGAPEDLW
jgi:cob(I)alamin adenosyltransferase